VEELMKLMMEIVLAGVWLIVVGVWVWSGWRFLPEADRLIKAWCQRRLNPDPFPAGEN
jgi:hypothetical protein